MKKDYEKPMVMRWDEEDEFYPGQPNYRTHVTKPDANDAKPNLSDKEKKETGLIDKREM